jgi:hypothetical protein
MLPTDLDQLMTKASILGEKLRRARLACDKQPRIGGDIKSLEHELAVTWGAIRLARLDGGDLPVYQGRRSKWD